MNEICEYKEEQFANYITVTVFWCERCGRLVKNHYDMNDWWEPKGSTGMNITVSITCPKCNHKYSYEIPAGKKGRSKPCPKCKYQDMRK